MRARTRIMVAALAMTIGSPAAAAPSAGGPRVAILRSGDLPAYTRPAVAFRAALEHDIPGVVIEEHDLAGNRARGERLLDQFTARGVDLVFAIGAKAAYLAARHQPALPVVFTSVLDWRSYRKALVRPNVAGVALEVPADVQLTQLKLLTPALERVVVITRGSGDHDAVLDDLIAAGHLLGIEIEPLPLADLDRLGQMANRDRFSTVVYPLANPAIYTARNFLRLVAESRRQRLPLIAFSKEFVEVGAVMAVDINYGDLGTQAALQATRILQDRVEPGALGVLAPVGTLLVVNEAAARAIGLTPSDTLLRLANITYDSVIELSPDKEGAFEPTSFGPADQSGGRDPWRDEVSESEFFAVKEDIVRVAARRTQQVSTAPSIVSVLTNQEMRLLGATNLAEALQHLPGFTHRYDQTGHYNILFRGQKEPADILVLVDGERLNNMYDGAAIYDLPIDNIRRVEVIRGPGSALYGTNAFAGVISITTYDADDDAAGSIELTEFPASSRPHLDRTFGARGYLRDSVALGKWRLGASGTFLFNQGAHMSMPLDLTGFFPPDEHHLLNDEKKKAELSLSLIREDLLTTGDRLHFHPQLYYHTQGPNFGPAETWAPNGHYHRDVLLVPLNYVAMLSQRLELKTRLSYTRQAIDNDIQVRPDDYTSRANPLPAPEGLRKRTDYTLHTVAIEPQLTLTLPALAHLWHRNLITFGALAEYGRVGRFNYEQNYLERFGSLIYWENFSPTIADSLADAGVPTTGFQNYNQLSLVQRDADRIVGSAYAESEVEVPRTSLGPAWLTLGVRLDYFSDYRAPSEDEQSPERKTYLTMNPRGALVWNPSFWDALEGLTLKAIHGWAFRAPSFSELYDSTEKITDASYRIPNEALVPQTTKVSELGAELRPIALLGNWGTARGSARGYRRYANALTARVNYFHMRTEDLLAPDPLFNPAGYQIINFAGQIINGYEAELRLRATAGDFVFANYSDVHAKQTGSCVRVQPDGNCPNDRKFISKEIREIPHHRFNLGASFRLIGLLLDLLGKDGGPGYRLLSPLTISAAYHYVSESANNARVTFEQLRFPFKHPGYDYLDLGLHYPFRLAGQDLTLRAFVYNVGDAIVYEPLIVQLDPRPENGYFLPRPGRRFALWLEWTR